ncbi:MAG: dinitrogenase iron-molybdenum cofactor biosynthesis protein [Candidatus Anammoximicrobium sp.]|nr:dinitrogenase iron-molybdenum cofactor biosynthesis protein [Candidatus Anammoximicrobium sp.]
MKVVVTAQDSSLDSPVDPRFGRARYFLLVDTDTGEFTAHDNMQNLNAAQGAGIQSAQTVVRLGAQALLSGNVGPKAFATLQAGQVAVYPGAAGTVRQALEELRSGRLQPAAQANVEGHWV